MIRVIFLYKIEEYKNYMYVKNEYLHFCAFVMRKDLEKNLGWRLYIYCNK